MNCTEFRAAIAAAMDDREALPLEIAVHLDQCADSGCRTDWDEAVLLQRAIGSWLSIQPKIDVSDAVVSEWRSEQNDSAPAFAATVRIDRRPERRSRSTTAGVMVAISAATVALVAVLLNSSGPSRPVADRGKRVLHQEPHGDAGLAYVTYAQNAAQIVTDAVVLTLGGAEQMEDPKVEPIPIGWEADWPPLGEVHAALDDLMESLPPEPPPS
jgi:hypothetical protein